MRAIFRTVSAFVLAAFFALSAWSAEGSAAEDEPLIRPAGDTDLSEFRWTKRPIIVFADSENDPAFVEQMEILSRRQDALLDRDVVVLTDTDDTRLSPIREQLRPRGFMLVIVSKEGDVQLRKPVPLSIREITRTIDKMPMRQREIRENKQNQ